MKIEVDFKGLIRLKQKINASETSWNLDDSHPLSALSLYEGEEVSSLNEIEIYCDLLTNKKGEQIILYIKDSRISEEKVSEPERAPKFHIADCRTLEEMRENNRSARYVTTTRATGTFLVDATNPDTQEVIKDLERPLHVCKNCLTKLGWNGYDPENPKKQRNLIVNEFSIIDFLATYSTFFKEKPNQSDITTKTGGYVKNWPEIANRHKERTDWKCEKCEVNLSTKKEYLHCHHKNGVIQENTSSNLEALCFECHANKPYHGQLKAILNKQPEIKKEIDNLRKRT